MTQITELRHTWKTFVESVNKKLEDAGISPDTPLWYIDIHYPFEDLDDFNVSIYEDGELIIRD